MGDIKSQSPASGSTGTTSARSKGGTAEGVVDQAKGVATQVAQRARAEIGARVGERTSRSAEELGQVSGALRMVEERLQGNMAGPWAGRAADQVDRFARLIEEGDVRRLLQETEGWARREPLLFLGGAFGLGLLGVRFLRSSAPRRETVMSVSSNTYPIVPEPLP